MSKRTNLWTGLILGAAAGAAATAFFKSKKGQEVMSKANNQLTHLKDATTEILQEEWEDISDRSSQLKNEANALAKDLKRVASKRIKKMQTAVNGNS